jgi:hypothetical protein
MVFLCQNKQIFSLYEDDPELTDSQNRRMANMVIAMGLWASLYASFEGQSDISGARRGLFTKPLLSVRNLFACVAIVAAIVAAVVVAPAVVISAAAATVIQIVAFGVGMASIAIVAALDKEEENKITHTSSPSNPPSPPPPPTVAVTLVNDRGRNVRYGKALMDGSPHEEFRHEVFHVGPNGDLLIDFWAPAGDFTGFTTETLNSGYLFIDEPHVTYGKYPLNLAFFANPPVTVEKKRNKHYGSKLDDQNISTVTVTARSISAL